MPGLLESVGQGSKIVSKRFNEHYLTSFEAVTALLWKSVMEEYRDGRNCNIDERWWKRIR
ncbi:hypothetical protein C5167_017769 [Papaver somniferum]|uniref:Uncharacterized protein n=1 Tax=Papaver somniferum TaxID=3469 RepID=A0A4Y7ING2_PAPSO|nr:hypothetical protein C5167_017769 [Papaver somniferum]